MKIDVLTIFPEMFEGVFGTSIIGRAVGTGKVEIKVHNLRDWSTDNYKSVDGHPFGGGAGMLMRVDVVERAIKDLKNQKLENSKTQNKDGFTETQDGETVVVLMDTKGEMYNQKYAEELSAIEHIILIAPHFEGIDHRVHENIADKVFCVGPYVLSGGELPVMTVVDSVVRLIPGALGNPESLAEESFSTDIEREYPQYTRPAEYNGWKVPEVLLSGDHKKIGEWRKGN
jgi:tRNA (guanine37-N1)-methyltransferase